MNLSMQAFSFYPVYQKRVWGGRKLESIYQRNLPEKDTAYGEAWELVDRTEAQSFALDGIYAGKSLHELWTNHREEVFGDSLPHSERFPILIKILDANDDLSLQVHPPKEMAVKFGGEPKTEMWFIADCEPDSKLYVGLKRGVTKEGFEKAIADGTVEAQTNVIIPQKGESIFIQSGRLHAIGAGFLIHEIQQNSDTTYRVFDWNRKDDQGNSRELHVKQSLACIDFTDQEVEMDEPIDNELACCPYFKTTSNLLKSGETIANPSKQRFSILIVVSGQLGKFQKGQTILCPRGSAPLSATIDSQILQITIP